MQQIHKRYTVYPIQNGDLWSLYKKSVASFWTAEEIDFSKDHADWELKLNENERHFIQYVLAFFAASDGIVNENLAERFLKDTDIPEAKFFYGHQIAMENIHSETYSLMIDTYIKDAAQKEHLFDAINNIPSINKKACWALKWIEDRNRSFMDRLVAFACVEGIFFSGAFCSIYWLKKRGLLPGLTFSNELISRDEALHCEFAVTMYNKLANEQNSQKMDTKSVFDIVREAVEIEEEFITEALPCRLIGMNSDLMKQYIQFVADRLLLQLGYGKLYNQQNPFEFMETISLEGKTNFFEKKVAEYNRANVGMDDKAKQISFDEDF